MLTGTPETGDTPGLHTATADTVAGTQLAQRHSAHPVARQIQGTAPTDAPTLLNAERCYKGG